MGCIVQHNTCPVCRHALPVETNPRRTTSQRDPEELHHPAVEAALSGIGQGHAHRTQSNGLDGAAAPFWAQRDRAQHMQVVLAAGSASFMLSSFMR